MIKNKIYLLYVINSINLGFCNSFESKLEKGFSTVEEKIKNTISIPQTIKKINENMQNLENNTNDIIKAQKKLIKIILINMVTTTIILILITFQVNVMFVFGTLILGVGSMLAVFIDIPLLTQSNNVEEKLESNSDPKTITNKKQELLRKAQNIINDTPME